jgi:hypothetical protein
MQAPGHFTGWGSMAKIAEALACGPRQARAEPA